MIVAAPGIREETIAFFLTVPHECGYLSGLDTVNVVVDPGLPVGTALYSRLAPLGFRRSGNRVYRPACPACAACVPLRVPVEDFLPQRSQRRAWERNSDLLVRERPPGFNAEHYALYCRYIAGRHPG
ncbi:MAG: arginyltransferase, partial [Gammaproteobacteria bacterium]|nr:arginyltransferase [Gammaproteobacteria bacterium]